MPDSITRPEDGPGSVTHLVQVQYDASTLTLDVKPQLRTLNPGDVIEWYFPVDLEGGVEAWRPRIKFHRYEGTSTVPNQQLGPSPP
jgi:hypothetical protein